MQKIISLNSFLENVAPAVIEKRDAYDDRQTRIVQTDLKQFVFERRQSRSLMEFVRY